MTSSVMEAIDGFLLGDGTIRFRHKRNTLQCGQKYEEMTKYFMSFFASYNPRVRKRILKPSNIRGKTLPVQVQYEGAAAHPDFEEQAKRWYPYGKKIVPKDLLLTPTSLLLWYLGDGCYERQCGHGHIVLHTQSFSAGDIDEILIPKLALLNIKATRRRGPTLYIGTGSLRAFFNCVGWQSPVVCYHYKFPTNDFLSNNFQTKEVSEMLGTSHIKLLRAVRSGKVSYDSKLYRKYWFSRDTVNKLDKEKVCVS